MFRLIFSINLESGFKSCVKWSKLVGSTLAIKVHFHAQFSSNPNQTLLNKLINVSRITRRLQAGEFGKGWSFTLQGNGSDYSTFIVQSVHFTTDYTLYDCVCDK